MNNIYLPAIRSKMGDWIFYSCVMRLSDIADRVNFAEELHKNKNLSKLIQRELEDKRSNAIKEYLLVDNERFFNSLVIAVYGGNPEWSDIDIKDGENSDYKLLNEYQGVNIGFLSLTGAERLFALDGQHRLAGIRKALKENPDIGIDSVTVIFVGHSNTPQGLQRTRKLFTTLNKNAKPVSKSQIIALDENDAVAVITRRLVEESELFFGKTISYNKGSNIPKSEQAAFTNITNLYDVLCIFLGEAVAGRKKNYWRDQLRPSDEDIDDFYRLSISLFDNFRKNFSELSGYFNQPVDDRSALNYRNESGGSVLFRPIGLLIFIEIFSMMYKETKDIEACVKRISLLPTNLADYPYKNVIWSSSGRKMVNANKTLARDLLLHRLGMFKGKTSSLGSRLLKVDSNADLTNYGIAL